MQYIPANAEYVGYVNYRQAYSVSGNSSLFGMDALIQLPQLGFSVIPVDVTYEVAIQLPEPKYSGSAILLQVSASKQAILSQELATSNLTRVRPPALYDGFLVYSLLLQEPGDRARVLATLLS